MRLGKKPDVQPQSLVTNSTKHYFEELHLQLPLEQIRIIFSRESLAPSHKKERSKFPAASICAGGSRQNNSSVPAWPTGAVLEDLSAFKLAHLPSQNHLPKLGPINSML